MKIRVSLLMIVLLLMQMVLPGVAPLQTASSEKDNVQNELFDFDSLSDDSYEEEDGHALELELDLPAEVEEVEVEEEVVEEPKKENLEIKTFNTNTYKDLGNIFTFKNLKIDDKDIADGDIIEIEADTVAQLGFTWNTEGLGAKAGDTASIQLSDAFLMVTTPKDQILVDGIVVGTYYVENGVLKFEFNENIENDEVQNGFVNLGLEFNLDKFRENVKQEIPFHDGHNQNITVIAKPNLNHSGIAKEGHPDSQHDAREITWTIDVINTNDEEITDATLADNIPAGLGEAREFVIHELSGEFDGHIKEGADVTDAANPTGFPIDLGTIAPFTGYRVKYTTTIEDYSAESFTNDATFEYGDTKLPAKATVDGLMRSDTIEKNGWHINGTNEIEWRLAINKNGQHIENAIVDEVLPKGLTVIEGSIEIYKNDQRVQDDEISAIEFPIKLGEVTPSDQYEIRFKTEVDWSEVNDGDYLQSNDFLNKAELYDDEQKIDDADHSVNISRRPILQKQGKDNVKYDDKTVTWTIHINEAGHPLGNVTLTDLIPAGLAITADDIVITDVTEGQPGVPYNPDNPVSIDLDPNAEGGTKVVIDLGAVGTRKLKVEYTTEITIFTINRFSKNVGMTGNGIVPDGENANASISPAGNTYSKSSAGIDYNAKTIDWRLNVNPVRENIKPGFVITDTFTNDGLILLPGTVNIKLDSVPLAEGTDYILAPIGDGYQNGFTITFNREIADGELVVEYTTSYDPQQEVDGKFLKPHSNENEKEVYRNKAEFDGETENGNPIKKDDDAHKEVLKDSWNSGKKEGQLVHFDEGNLVNGWISGAERKIAWQLYINYQEQDLGTGVVVTDELAYAGNIDADSIKVSVYEVKPNGETMITDTVLNSDNYSVNTDEDGKFILTFADDFEVNERYVIEFTTSVPDISADSYTNDASVRVDDVDYDYSATVNYNEHDDFLAKKAVNAEGNRVFTGDEVEWEVRVNESLSIIKEAVITDTISAGHVYLNGSLEIYKSQDLESPLLEGTDYTLEVVPVTDENEELTGATNLVIKTEGALQDTLVLKYTTVVTETNGTISNDISLEGTAFEQKSVESAKINARQFANVGGEWSQSRGAIRLTKIDAETNETIANNKATFELWYELNGKKQRFGEEEYTTENGVLEIGNLPFRTYYLKEVEAPDGYVLLEDEDDWLEIVVDTAIGNNLNNPTFIEANFKNTKEKVNITGTKEWIGGEALRPDSIELQLLRDGEPYDEPVTLVAGETEYTWTDLDKTDIDGNEYEYTVDEVEVPNYFEKVNSTDGLKITNTFESPLIDISVEKVWEDGENQDGKRASSIEVQLFANDDEYGDPITLSAATNWQGEFTDLPEYDETGKEIEYTFGELNVHEDYQVDINDQDLDNVIITNSYTPEVINISGEKIWDDANNQDGVRPDEITVNLLANGTQVRHQVVKADEDGNWNYEFTDLPKFQAGEEITYTITENEVEGYTTEIEGYNIKNSYTPEERSITVTKAWLDGNNQDGKRADSVQVQLFANDHPLGDPITLSDENNWTYTWKGLAVNEAGEEIEYTFEELNVHEDYQVDINDENLGNVIITNAYTPEVINISGEKIWDDADNQDGIRPEFITVNLLADGEQIDSQEVTSADNWNYVFEGFPRYKAGEEIEYTVLEEEVDGYEVSYDEFEITNSYTPEIIDLSGTKTWDDADDQDGKRPDSIIVRLLANGEEVDFVEVTAETDWTFEFTDLPKFENGVEITYTVQEDFVADYSATIDGFDITNSYTPGKTSINVVKVWDDRSDQAGIRPDQITVILFANGEKTDYELTLTADGNWQGDFIDLDTHQNGVAIEYTIEEISVEGYETEIKGTSENGFVITNSHDPDEPETPTEEPEDPTEGKEDPKDGHNLPRTATNLFNFLVIGLGLLISGLVLIIISGGKRRLEN